MDIRVLQYFLAVAREESITKAAEALRMTQPPLSRQLKDLEEELGKQLLIRGSKRLLVGEADISKYDYLKLSQKDLWGVLMRKDSPLAEKETICAEDLWDKPLIVSHQASDNTEMFRWLRSDISKLNIVATYDLIYNAAQFVKKGFGYVIALDRLINTTGDNNLCFKPLFPTLEAELCIASNDNTYTAIQLTIV